MNSPFAHLYWNPDNVHNVTLQKLSSSPGGAVASETIISGAYRGIPSREERTASAGVDQVIDTVYRIAKATISGTGVIPYPGDVFLASGSLSHAIKWVHEVQLTQQYRCGCIKLEIYSRLQQLLTVERPTYTQDEFKLNVPDSWNAVYTDIPCRVQPTAAPDTSEGGMVGSVGFFDITVDRQLTLTTNDRLTVAGKTYTFLDYVTAERITDLPVLKVRDSH